MLWHMTYRDINIHAMWHKKFYIVASLVYNIYIYIYIYMTGFAKRVLYMHPIVWLRRGITLFVSKLLSWNFLSYKYNDRKILLPNFIAVGQTHTELYSLKVEKLDACIRPLFANLVTYIFVAWARMVCLIYTPEARGLRVYVFVKALPRVLYEKYGT